MCKSMAQRCGKLRQAPMCTGMSSTTCLIHGMPQREMWLGLGHSRLLVEVTQTSLVMMAHGKSKRTDWFKQLTLGGLTSTSSLT